MFNFVHSRRGLIFKNKSAAKMSANLLEIKSHNTLIDSRVHCLLFASVLALLSPGAKSQLFLGGPCTFGGYSTVKGECTPLANCPSAISHFRATGVSPSLCYTENDVSVICCQKEKRISEKKCYEYAQQLVKLQSTGPSFSPLAVGGYEDNDPQPSENLGCNGTKFLLFVVAGRNAEKYEMSFTVALGYDDGKGVSWKCGGTLISDQYILTAGHCLDGQGKGSSKPSVVLLGDKNLQRLDSFSSQHRVEAKVAEIFIHPEYQRPLKYNDIGLLKLDRKVSFSRSLLPACLPRPESKPETVNDFLIAGWGRLEYFGKRGEVLQMANINRMSHKECNQNYGTSQELPKGIIKSQICAGDKDGSKDSCEGDSGGPLTTKTDPSTCMQTIMGLVSFGDKFCGSGTPAVYTNVQSYLDYIESIVWADEI